MFPFQYAQTINALLLKRVRGYCAIAECVLIPPQLLTLQLCSSASRRIRTRTTRSECLWSSHTLCSNMTPLPGIWWVSGTLHCRDTLHNAESSYKVHSETQLVFRKLDYIIFSYTLKTVDNLSIKSVDFIWHLASRDLSTGPKQHPHGWTLCRWWVAVAEMCTHSTFLSAGSLPPQGATTVF